MASSETPTNAPLNQEILSLSDSSSGSASGEKNNKKRKGKALSESSKKKKKSSETWLYFTKNVQTGKAVCNACKKYLSYKGSRSSGTSHLMQHAKNYCTERKVSGLMDKHLVGEKKADGSVQMVAHSYNPAKIRQAIVLWVIEAEQSFRQVEHPSFIRMLKAIDPRVVIPSRFTIAREVLKLFASMAADLRRFFRGFDGYVSLTTDIWTSVQNMSYMCVTAHYVDCNWEIHKKVITFKTMVDHKGNTIGKVLFDVIREMGIRRIACVTVDNASANKVAIDYLKGKLRKEEMLLEGKHMHFRCGCHIINLIVQEGMKVSNDSIQRIRAAVKCIRSSPSREKVFKSHCEWENITFDSKLWLDTVTRWNSTFIMLTKVYPFRSAIMRMQVDDNWGLVDVDWEMAHIYIKFLGLFCDATRLLSATKQATIHQYAMQMCSLQRVIRDRLNSEETQDPLLVDVAVEMQAKFERYWGGDEENKNLLLCVASMLDPRNKTKLTSVIFSYLFPQQVCERLLTSSRSCLQELCDLYNKEADSITSLSTGPALSSVSSSSQQESRSSEGLRSLMKDFYASCSPSLLTRQTSELEQYLDVDGLVEYHEGLDVLLWWKVNGHKYPTLQRIVRDIFAIPVSTVASESTFSTGGRTITDYRSRLAPEMVEALICVQSWVSKGSFTLVSAVETIEIFENDDDSGANSTTEKESGKMKDVANEL